jgi:hypothetical protein
MYVKWLLFHVERSRRSFEFSSDFVRFYAGEPSFYRVIILQSG